jgi:8-oxo-dGTP diphosphatase
MAETRHCYAHPHPAVTTDVCVFTIRDEALRILLIRRGNAPFRGLWALPGGFVDIDEDLDRGAARELAEETGLSGLPLEQFRTFGAVGRDPRERVISVAYLALAPAQALRPRAGDDAAETAWAALQELPELAFDHAAIIRSAVERLRWSLDHPALALRLVSGHFSLDALRQVYEILLDAAIDERNFRQWIEGLCGPGAGGRPSRHDFDHWSWADRLRRSGLLLGPGGAETPS